MRVRVGKISYESTFTPDGWKLVPEDKKQQELLIPYHKIYNYFAHSMSKKFSIPTLIFIGIGVLFLTFWMIFVFIPPILYFYFYSNKVRLVTEEGDIYVTFNNSADRDAFYKDCKKNIKIRRVYIFKENPSEERKGNLGTFLLSFFDDDKKPDKSGQATPVNNNVDADKNKEKEA